MRFSATPRQRACVVESMLRMGRGLKTDTKLCPFLVKYVARLIGCQALISSPKKADDTHQKRFHKNNLVPNTLHSQKGLSDRKSNIFYATVCLPTFWSKLGAPFFEEQPWPEFLFTLSSSLCCSGTPQTHINLHRQPQIYLKHVVKGRRKNVTSWKLFLTKRFFQF